MTETDLPAACVPRETVARSAARIAAAGHILLVTHKRPDGDALGSLLGLGQALEDAGKRVTFLDVDGCPATFRFLPGHEKIQGRLVSKADEPAPDLLVTLDTSELSRLGRIAESLPRPVDVNVDHHVTNTGFGEINIVKPRVASTAEIVLALLEPWELSLTGEVATCLLTGLLTDTLGFRTSSTTPATLDAAMRLMRAGASLPDLLRQGLHRRSFAAARLWGVGLSRLALEDRLVHTWLSLADKQALGYNGRDDADLINMLSTVEDADVAIIFVEQTPTRTKVSWRARPGIDITPVAASFGGGGHPAASGAEAEGSLETIRERVLKATRDYLASEAQEREK